MAGEPTHAETTNRREPKGNSDCMVCR